MVLQKAQIVFSPLDAFICTCLHKCYATLQGPSNVFRTTGEEEQWGLWGVHKKSYLLLTSHKKKLYYIHLN
jgi:hypothetical protein